MTRNRCRERSPSPIGRNPTPGQFDDADIVEGLAGRFRTLSRKDLAGYRCLRLPARSHPWASTHRDVTFNLTTPSWTSATADGGRYSLDDRRPRDTVSRISLEFTTVPSRVSSLSWTSHPRAMSANRNVRRGGSSRPPTIGERADALHLRSGPYDIGVTRAEARRGCRVIGQPQIPGSLQPRADGCDKWPRAGQVRSIRAYSAS